MYYIEACKKCGRHGSVAEKEDDKICKLCKEKSWQEKDKPKQGED